MHESGNAGESFKRSSFCNAQTCVEVAIRPLADEVIVRDSKNPRYQLRFNLREWSDFLTGVHASEFEIHETRP